VSSGRRAPWVPKRPLRDPGGEFFLARVRYFRYRRRFCHADDVQSLLKSFGLGPHPTTSTPSPPLAAAAPTARPAANRAAVAARAAKKSDSSDALSALKRESDLLKETAASAAQEVAALEAEAAALGVSVGADGAEASPAVPEDSWMPGVPDPGYGVTDLPADWDAPQALPPVPDHDGTECLKFDDTLWSHADHFRYRWSVYRGVRDGIDASEGGLEAFSRSYEYFGLNRGTDDAGNAGLWYREWAPGAQAVALVGDWNGWNPRDEHWAIKNDFGVFQLFLPDGADGKPQVPHRAKVKSRVVDATGATNDRIPAYIRWATQEAGEIQFNGCHWAPETVSAPGVLEADSSYTFKYPRPPKPRAMRIYEAHVGMAGIDERVHTYTEFRDNVLPRVRSLGYNAIQLMAVQEHAYYGSFGYHVTNFFAPSSRCGTPEELKSLIDEAHRMGIHVLMDIVHSHASKNAQDGLNTWDGTDHQYFHSGGRGYHWVWDSRCFNYSNWETLRFLISNTRYWMDEFKFDGFRFDGVTSMMYSHHGLATTFTGNYDEYFGMATDVDAVVYLMLVNEMVKGFWPHAVVVGEDVSGMPTFCRPVSEGGVGFDFRLNMAAPDMWIDMMKVDDQAWGMGHIAHTLTNRRYGEDVIGYAESHDQALVGDKTIAFWLMDAAMYDGMAAPGFGPQSPAVDRGIALHKMVRLVTMALGGQGYLNFMGNEFGHPEWIDFPRDSFTDPSTGKFIPGNGGSFALCRRRWDLADADFLKYRFMQSFDRAMNHLDRAFGFMTAPHQWISRKDEGDKVLVVERGDLLFVFNFHPVNSYTDYRVGCNEGVVAEGGKLGVVLSSDEEVFGGYRNVTADNGTAFVVQDHGHDGRPKSVQVYAPSRTVVVYAPAEHCLMGDAPPADAVPGLSVRGLGPYTEVTSGALVRAAKAGAK